MLLSFENALIIFSVLLSCFSRVRLSFFCISGCVLTLFYYYLSSNFSVESVYHSSHKNLDLLYKFSAIWTTNEGSMLLWVWVLSFYAIFLDIFFKKSTTLKIAITVQSYLVATFLVFVLFVANPFTKVVIAAKDGIGLNPVLQDIALSVHPPTLYFGYIGFSLCFAYSVAMLLANNFTKKDFELLNQLHLIAFSILTIGVGLGSWWAYRELGWGGFWSWDPVENISIMPWLLSLGAIHAIFAAKKYQKLQLTSVLLSILPFLSGIFGTLITRAGLLESLHTFANAKEQGIYLLFIFFSIALFGLIPFSLRLTKMRFAKIKTNKNTYLMTINFSVCLALFASILVTILLPIFFYLSSSASIYTDAKFYNKIFAYSAILLAFCITLFPVFSVRTFISRYKISLILLLIVFIFAIKSKMTLICFLLMISGFFLSFAVLEHYFKSIPQINFLTLITTTKNAFLLSHLSLGVFMIGVAVFFSFSLEAKQYFKPGDSVILGNQQIVMQGYQKLENSNFNGIKAFFKIANNKMLAPELRFYKKEKMLNAESKTAHNIASDLMIVISGIDKEFGVATEIYCRKGVILVWFSFLLLSLGCFLKVLNVIKRNMQSQKS